MFFKGKTGSISCEQTYGVVRRQALLWTGMHDRGLDA
jgi:hypothetical protein